MEIVAREAPYRLPSRLDLSRLQALTSAKKSQAIDHAVALREDPAYFAETVEEYRNNRPELVLDQDGKSHEHAEDFPLYAKVLRHVASDAHCAVFYWDYMHKGIVKVQELHTKYTSKMSVEEDLPIEFSASLAQIRFFIERISLDIITNIKTAFAASPPLRDYHFRYRTAGSSSRKFLVLERENASTENASLQRVLRWKLILEDYGLRENYTLHNVLDEFGRLMQVDPRAKELISPYIADHISQLSVMSECLHQLHQFQPWARKIEDDIQRNFLKFGLQYDRLLTPWGRIIKAYRKFEDPKICEAGTPKDGKFDYPADKRRTADSVKKMIAAEEALETFWKLANANFRCHTGATPTGLVRHIIGDRPVHRTLPWIEPEKVNPEKFEPLEIFSGHLHDTDKQITGNFDKLSISSKVKIKTRGAIAAKNETSTSLSVEPVTTSQPKITVDKRALKVFRTLFHSPDNPNQPGEVPWRNFLHAMLSAGFATEKLQGSAWHFNPMSANVERSIQFHEPHPDDKLPFTWARRYGRRLNRAFGWTLETFSLA